MNLEYKSHKNIKINLSLLWTIWVYHTCLLFRKILWDQHIDRVQKGARRWLTALWDQQEIASYSTLFPYEDTNEKMHNISFVKLLVEYLNKTHTEWWLENKSLAWYRSISKLLWFILSCEVNYAILLKRRTLNFFIMQSKLLWFILPSNTGKVTSF